MPVSYIPSAEQLVDRQKTTAKKRRRNQNAEIDELAKLLPVKQLPMTPHNVGVAMEFGAMVDRNKQQQQQLVDKISVLRIVSTYLRFQEFIKKGILPQTEGKRGSNSERVITDMMAEAIDGFLLVLDQDGTILFVSESITCYVGLTQNDVIGLQLEEITHPDDRDVITDNLTAKNTLPPGVTNRGEDTQPRQFYIRLKSTMSPGRIQLSRFSSYTRIQITGSLKVRSATSSLTGEENMADAEEEEGEAEYSPGPSMMEVVGFVGECRLIECTSSILEISAPQPYFTTTISLNMKIVAVETQMQEITGFTTDHFIGTRLMDYFHPADYLKLIPCEVILMHTGHAVSPVFRFMAASGGWIWMQMEGMLRYKPGTKERQFWEVKSKIISQEEGQLALIEQKELYTSNSDPNQDFLNPHKDKQFLSRLADAANLCDNQEAKKPIVKKLKEANLSESAINGYLEGREQGLFQLPGGIKEVLRPKEVLAFKDGSLFKRLERESLSVSSVKSPASGDLASATESPPQSSAVSPTLTSTLSTLSSTSDLLSSAMSVGEHDLMSTLLTQPSHAYSDEMLPPSKRPNLDHQSQVITGYVPTAHVKPIPRQTSRQQKLPSLDLLEEKSEANLSVSPNFTLGNSNASIDGTTNDSNHSSWFNVTYQPSPDLFTDFSLPNSFQTLPASNTTSGVFGQASSFSSELVPPATVGSEKVTHQDSQHLSSYPSNGMHQTVGGTTAPMTSDTDFHSQNGDPVLENLLKEMDESEMVSLASSSNGFCHAASSDGYKTGTPAGLADSAVLPGSSKDLNGGVWPSSGTNTELMEILSQFS